MPDQHPTLEEVIASKIIKELNSRGGFDHWWGSMDEETQTDVIYAIASIIQSQYKAATAAYTQPKLFRD